MTPPRSRSGRRWRAGRPWRRGVARNARVELPWLTELWWADPPRALVERICRDARLAIPRGAVKRSRDSDPVIARQPRERAIGIELHRRLRILGIFVEGVTDVGEDCEGDS